MLTFAFARAITGNFDYNSFLFGSAGSVFECAFVAMRLPLCVTHGRPFLRAFLVAFA